MSSRYPPDADLRIGRSSKLLILAHFSSLMKDVGSLKEEPFLSWLMVGVKEPVHLLLLLRLLLVDERLG